MVTTETELRREKETGGLSAFSGCDQLMMLTGLMTVMAASRTCPDQQTDKGAHTQKRGFGKQMAFTVWPGKIPPRGGGGLQSKGRSDNSTSVM